MKGGWTIANKTKPGNGLPTQSRVAGDRSSDMAPFCRSLKRDFAPFAFGYTGRNGLDQLAPLQVPNWVKGVRGTRSR